MTYQEAKKAANKNNAGIFYTGDAGNGCKFEVYFCASRNRQVWSTVSSSGVRF